MLKRVYCKMLKSTMQCILFPLFLHGGNYGKMKYDNVLNHTIGGNSLHILFIGDLVGSSGRKLLRAKLPEMKKKWQVDICIANAENVAAGLGLTATLAHDIQDCGVDIMTLGNHSWSKHEFLYSAENIRHLVRPANVPKAWPGRGYTVYDHPAGKLLVINLLGRVFMEPADDPFATADQMLNELKSEQGIKMTVVDFHAEATSEKNAMAWFLDGRVSLVAGTHTHIQTADERILERGTAFITDVGMTGPINGVIGMERESSLRRFVDRLPAPYEVAKGYSALCAVCVEVDPSTGQARRIERIRIEE